jgi:hypothetical protein
LEDILNDNTTISQLQTDHDNRLKLRFAKLKPVRGYPHFMRYLVRCSGVQL